MLGQGRPGAPGSGPDRGVLPAPPANSDVHRPEQVVNELPSKGFLSTNQLANGFGMAVREGSHRVVHGLQHRPCRHSDRPIVARRAERQPARGDPGGILRVVASQPRQNQAPPLGAGSDLPTRPHQVAESFDPVGPAHRFTHQAAVLGARLLGGPNVLTLIRAPPRGLLGQTGRDVRLIRGSGAADGGARARTRRGGRGSSCRGRALTGAEVRRARPCRANQPRDSLDEVKAARARTVE